MVEFLRGIGRRVLEGYSLKPRTQWSKSYVVLVGCFGIVFGIIAHSFLNFKMDFFWIYNAALFLGVLILLFWRDKKIRLIFIGVFFVVAGFARFDLGIEENKILPDYYEKEIKIIGIVSDEPINKIDKQQLIIEPEEAGGKEFYGKEKILLTVNLYPKYKYGGKLEFNCRLKKPEKFEDFDYARYLSMRNIYGLCYYPDMQKNTNVKTGEHKIIAGLLKAKTSLILKINQNLHEPLASFLSGLVVGARNAIPPDLINNFQRTGTTHIIAISGWNITFLGLIFLPVLFHLRLNRRQAFFVMLGLIIIFVLLVGAGASVMRAGIMGMLALYAKAFGRYSHAGRALLYSIVLMFLINPQIIYDVGFWLSVSATFGIIYFSPIAENFLNPKKLKFKLIRDNLTTTISAVIFTLPISSFVFGYISVWALPVNIIILPFVAYAIICALPVLPFLPFVPQAVGQIMLLPGAAIMNFIVKIINFFGSIPFGYFPFKVNFFVMLALYAALLWLTFRKLKQINNEI